MISENEALEWIAELFEEEPGRIIPEVKREEIPAWDSLGVLTLMAGLDNDFGIVLSDDDMMNMEMVSDILDILKQHEDQKKHQRN